MNFKNGSFKGLGPAADLASNVFYHFPQYIIKSLQHIYAQKENKFKKFFFPNFTEKKKRSLSTFLQSATKNVSYNCKWEISLKNYWNSNWSVQSGSPQQAQKHENKSFFMDSKGEIVVIGRSKIKYQH